MFVGTCFCLFIASDISKSRIFTVLGTQICLVYIVRLKKIVFSVYLLTDLLVFHKAGFSTNLALSYVTKCSVYQSVLQ